MHFWIQYFQITTDLSSSQIENHLYFRFLSFLHKLGLAHYCKEKVRGDNLAFPDLTGNATFSSLSMNVSYKFFFFKCLNTDSGILISVANHVHLLQASPAIRQQLEMFMMIMDLYIIYRVITILLPYCVGVCIIIVQGKAQNDIQQNAQYLHVIINNSLS